VKPADVVRALVYPVSDSSVLIPLLVFWLLTSFAIWGGLLGLFLVFLIVVPAVIRFQMIVLEARARAVRPATPAPDMSIRVFRSIDPALRPF